jgi:hypothetical protein
MTSVGQRQANDLRLDLNYLIDMILEQVAASILDREVLPFEVVQMFGIAYRDDEVGAGRPDRHTPAIIQLPGGVDVGLPLDRAARNLKRLHARSLVRSQCDFSSNPPFSHSNPHPYPKGVTLMGTSESNLLKCLRRSVRYLRPTPGRWPTPHDGDHPASHARNGWGGPW